MSPVISMIAREVDLPAPRAATAVIGPPKLFDPPRRPTALWHSASLH
ncbi:hypothetical protein [Rhizobium sp. AN80A]|nr:hypothetical protein [Rhizobium sp. AN80A]